MLPANSVLELALIFIPLLLIVGLRSIFLFRQYRSWITFAIRIFGFFVPIGLSIFLISIVTVILSVRSESQEFTPSKLIFLAIGSLLGCALAYLLGRKFEPSVVERLEKITRPSGRKETFTDIRTVQKDFVSLGEIDLEREFKFAMDQDHVFLGIDKNKQAITVSRAYWKQNHVQIMGPPGTGKGIQAAVTLAQSLRYGDAVFIFDPKNDEWAPSVFFDACKKASLPFRFVNLREAYPQLNPLSNASRDDVAEMLYSGLSLSRRGTDADFYRLDDRKAARIASSFVTDNPLTLIEMLRQTQQSVDVDLQRGAKSFFASLAEVAELECVKTRQGVDLSLALNQGGCVYIVGSMRNEPMIYLQKMLFIRILQLVEQQERSRRHCSIFLDEFKYLLSATTVNALGSVRDKGCNILLAHQSLGDFANCSADLSETAVRTTVLDTTPIKWLYRAADWETANWISNQTGQILVTTQRLTGMRNPELAETFSDSRTIGEAPRNLIDTNMVLSLPKQYAVCIGAGTPRLGRVSPLKVTKMKISVHEAPKVKDVQLDLLHRVSEQSTPKDQFEVIPTSIFELEPQRRLLYFLYSETWTTSKIIDKLLADLSPSDNDKFLQELDSKKLIRNFKLAHKVSSEEEIWGITKFGMHHVLENEQLAQERRIFNKRSVNPISLNHKIDIQELRLTAECNGWIEWESHIHKQINKRHEIIPDAIAKRADGVCVAIEVERTIKKASRYKTILVAHLNARKARRWDEIYYMSPNKTISNRIKRIFLDISEITYFGEIIQLNDEHKAPFRFFSYQDNWTKTP